MNAPPITLSVQPIALRREHAAAALGMSVDHFDQHVRPHLRVTRSETLKVYAVEELQRWARENASAVLGEDR